MTKDAIQQPNEFKAALDRARRELGHIERTECELAQRKAQLLHSIAGLSALCGEMPPISSLSLADAIRAVLQNHRKMNPSSGLKPTEIRDQLRGIGFDLSAHANEMASIGTALKRMRDTGEVELVGDAAFSNIHRWKEQAPARSSYGIPNFDALASIAAAAHDAAAAGHFDPQWAKGVAEQIAKIGKVTATLNVADAAPKKDTK